MPRRSQKDVKKATLAHLKRELENAKTDAQINAAATKIAAASGKEAKSIFEAEKKKREKAAARIKSSVSSAAASTPTSRSSKPSKARGRAGSAASAPARQQPDTESRSTGSTSPVAQAEARARSSSAGERRPPEGYEEIARLSREARAAAKSAGIREKFDRELGGPKPPSEPIPGPPKGEPFKAQRPATPPPGPPAASRPGLKVPSGPVSVPGKEGKAPVSKEKIDTITNPLGSPSEPSRTKPPAAGESAVSKPKKPTGPRPKVEVTEARIDPAPEMADAAVVSGQSSSTPAPTATIEEASPKSPEAVKTKRGARSYITTSSTITEGSNDMSGEYRRGSDPIEDGTSPMIGEEFLEAAATVTDVIMPEPVKLSALAGRKEKYFPEVDTAGLSEDQALAKKLRDALDKAMFDHMYGKDTLDYDRSAQIALDSEELGEILNNPANTERMQKTTDPILIDAMNDVMFASEQFVREGAATGRIGPLSAMRIVKRKKVQGAGIAAAFTSPIQAELHVTDQESRKSRTKTMGRLVARMALAERGKELSEENITRLADVLTQGSGMLTRRGVARARGDAAGLESAGNAAALAQGLSLADVIQEGFFLDAESLTKYSLFGHRTVEGEMTRETPQAPQPIHMHKFIQEMADTVDNPEKLSTVAHAARENFAKAIWERNTVLGAKHIRETYPAAVVKKSLEEALGGMGAVDMGTRIGGVKVGPAARPWNSHKRFAEIGSEDFNAKGFNSHIKGGDNFTRSSLPEWVISAAGMGGYRRKQFFEVNHSLEFRIRNNLKSHLVTLPDEALQEVQADMPLLVEAAMLACAENPKVPFTLVGQNTNDKGLAAAITEEIKKGLPATTAEARAAIIEERGDEIDPEKHLAPKAVEGMRIALTKDRMGVRRVALNTLEEKRARLQEYAMAAQNFPWQVQSAMQEAGLKGVEFDANMNAALAKHMMEELQSGNVEFDKVADKVKEFASHMPSMLGLKGGEIVSFGMRRSVANEKGLKRLAEQAGKKAGEETVVISAGVASNLVVKTLKDREFDLDTDLQNQLAEAIKPQIQFALDQGKTLDLEKLKDSLGRTLDEKLKDKRSEHRGKGAKPVITRASILAKDDTDRGVTGAFSATSRGWISFISKSNVIADIGASLSSEVLQQMGGMTLTDCAEAAVKKAEELYNAKKGTEYGPMRGSLRSEIRKMVEKGLAEGEGKFTDDRVAEMGEAIAVVLSHSTMTKAAAEANDLYSSPDKAPELSEAAFGQRSWYQYFTGQDNPEWQKFTTALEKAGEGDYVEAFKAAKTVSAERSFLPEVSKEGITTAITSAKLSIEEKGRNDRVLESVATYQLAAKRAEERANRPGFRQTLANLGRMAFGSGRSSADLEGREPLLGRGRGDSEVSELDSPPATPRSHTAEEEARRTGPQTRPRSRSRD
ncbi:MAG: hypothetical protein RLN62_02335 [Rickettsiales bacterium]